MSVEDVLRQYFYVCNLPKPTLSERELFKKWLEELQRERQRRLMRLYGRPSYPLI